METTFNEKLAQSHALEAPKASIYRRFMNWCEGQEKNKLLWLGIILTAHGCIITPITIFIVLMGGNNIYLFVLTLAAMGLSLVSNLAAMPTSKTIPAFVVSMLIDIVIIISCAFMGLSVAGTM